MASAYSQLVGPPPSALTFAFRRWYFDLLRKRLAECPIERATVYHFDATAGDDETGDGSIGAPFKTLAKAQAVHAAWEQDDDGLALLFKRGQEWREALGLTADKNYVTVGAYGTGDRPLFSNFTQQVPAGSAWTQVSGNHYKLAEASTVAWVRKVADRLTPIHRAASATEVGANANTWFYDAAGGELHINIGADPNAVNLEYALSNDVDGVLVTGDGCRIDSIRCDGWGMNPANALNQNYGIKTSVTGSQAVVVSNCEVYYSSAHPLAQYAVAGSASGGIVTFIDCTAGFAIGSPTGIFNNYTTHGDQEWICHQCSVPYGGLPTSVAYTSGGTAFQSHGSSTPDNPLRLIVLWGCRTVPGRSDGLYRCRRPSTWGASMVAGRDAGSTLASQRIFIVDDVFESMGEDTTCEIWTPGVVRINPHYRLRTSTALALHGARTGGWCLNGVIDADFSDASGGGQIRGFCRNADPEGQRINWQRSYHTQIVMRNTGTRRVVIDNRVENGDDVNNEAVRYVHCIFDNQCRDGLIVRLCIRNHADSLVANAYRRLQDSADPLKGYDADAWAAALSDPVATHGRELIDDQSPLQVNTELNAAVNLQFDQIWRPRDPQGPAFIGPYAPFSAVDSDQLAIALSDIDSLLTKVQTAMNHMTDATAATVTAVISADQIVVMMPDYQGEASNLAGQLLRLPDHLFATRIVAAGPASQEPPGDGGGVLLRLQEALPASVSVGSGVIVEEIRGRRYATVLTRLA